MQPLKRDTVERTREAWVRERTIVFWINMTLFPIILVTRVAFLNQVSSQVFISLYSVIYIQLFIISGENIFYKLTLV
jgi:hypothetical protein